MTPNPEFISVAEAHVPKEAPIIVGCQMGARSQLAAELMMGAGYTDVSNMEGGFSGARSPLGEIVAPGWVQFELPVETGAEGHADYAALRRNSPLSER